MSKNIKDRASRIGEDDRTMTDKLKDKASDIYGKVSGTGSDI
jgi:hypothetical protein